MPHNGPIRPLHGGRVRPLTIRQKRNPQCGFPGFPMRATLAPRYLFRLLDVPADTDERRLFHEEAARLGLRSVGAGFTLAVEGDHMPDMDGVHAALALLGAVAVAVPGATLEYATWAPGHRRLLFRGTLPAFLEAVAA